MSAELPSSLLSVLSDQINAAAKQMAEEMVASSGLVPRTELDAERAVLDGREKVLLEMRDQIALDRDEVIDHMGKLTRAVVATNEKLRRYLDSSAAATVVIDSGYSPSPEAVAVLRDAVSGDLAGSGGLDAALSGVISSEMLRVSGKAPGA